MLARLHGSTLCIASCHSAGQERLNNRKIKSGRLPEFGVAVLFPFPCVTAALLLPIGQYLRVHIPGIYLKLFYIFACAAHAATHGATRLRHGFYACRDSQHGVQTRAAPQ